MTENTTTTASAETPPVHCFVRHKDAGGQCYRPGIERVYGIGFCEAHGEEARLGAYIEEYDEAYTFFERFRNPHIPSLSSPVERAVEAALDQIQGGPPSGTLYYVALLQAYMKDAPEDVRAKVAAWEEDEELGYAPVLDCLLDSLRIPTSSYA